MLNEIHNIFDKKPKKIKDIEFEKDDDSNGHIDFITFYTNFRAINYFIQPAKRHQIKI